MTSKPTKTALAIRHVGFEDLGSYADPLRAQGYEIRYCEAGRDDLGALLGYQAPLPDLLVVLGGPIGAYEEADYPLLNDEIDAVSRQLKADRPLIGICLGAQLIARALGARVFPGQKEIGWGPLFPSPEGANSCLAPLAENDWQVLHWHGDTFDLPDGAHLLASTSMTENQAFTVGPRVLGLQFHVEAQTDSIEQWLIGHAVELSQARVDLFEIRAETARWGAGLERACPQILQSWLERANDGAR